MGYIQKMPLKSISRLILKAVEQNNRETLYKLWLVRYPLYTKDNYESFQEFYDSCQPQRTHYDTRSKDEIMQEILELQERSC